MIKKCEQCGKEFEAKRKDARFCSDSCRKKAKRASKRKEKECLSCGQKFIPKHGAEIYCSDYCKEFEIRERMRIQQQDYRDPMDSWKDAPTADEWGYGDSYEEY